MCVCMHTCDIPPPSLGGKVCEGRGRRERAVGGSSIAQPCPSPGGSHSSTGCLPAPGPGPSSGPAVPRAGGQWCQSQLCHWAAWERTSGTPTSALLGPAQWGWVEQGTGQSHGSFRGVGKGSGSHHCRLSRQCLVLPGRGCVLCSRQVAVVLGGGLGGLQ